MAASRHLPLTAADAALEGLGLISEKAAIPLQISANEMTLKKSAPSST